MNPTSDDTPPLSPKHRPWLMCILALHIFAIACFGSPATNPMMQSIPRWSCPTPTALPTIQIDTGPTVDAAGTVVAGTRDTEPYEREYGNATQPIPRPTPYTKAGTTFLLGQIVNLTSALDLQITIETKQAAQASVPISDTQLYLLKLHWENRGTAFMLAPARQVVLSAIQGQDGRQTGGQWHWSREAALAAGLPDSEDVLQHEVPLGSSDLTIPVLAPVGTPQTMDVQLDPPNADVQTAGTFRVQFTMGREPNCAAPGTVAATYEDDGTGIAPPIAPGTDLIVASALRQVGRQYCWGGKGWSPCDGFGGGPTQVTPGCASYPCFDCSGLTAWAYRDNGIAVLDGTSNQQNYPAVPKDAAQPGDLLLFGGINQAGRGTFITHVGLAAGDLDGDGKMDMVQAANWPTGVIITHAVFENPYYRSRLAIITRPPHGLPAAGGRP